MFLRCFVIAFLCVVLCGCLSVSPHGSAIEDLGRYRIVDVAVEGAEIIRSWPTEEERFVRSGVVDAAMADRIRAEPATNFPQLAAHFQQVLTARLKGEFVSSTASVFAGKQPATAVVRLKTFDIPSAARRVFVDNMAKIQAEIDVLDKTTG